VLSIVVVMTWFASNLVHGRIGRMWMSVRDMDLAAELVGIRLLRTKLLAFAVSSFYCGVAGAMMVFLWYGGAEADVFAIDQSFLVLFMVIIGGLGTLIGSFFGAALIYILPIALRAIPQAFGLASARLYLSSPARCITFSQFSVRSAAMALSNLRRCLTKSTTRPFTLRQSRCR
jgi:branched-chain amino acid transport system permease protein